MAERKSRQLTPAKFGVDATRVGGGNLSSASHVQKGVVDEGAGIDNADSINRTAKGIQGGLQFASDARDKFTELKLQNDQNNTIQEFVDSRNQPIPEELQDEAKFQLQAEEFSGFNNGNAVTENTTQVAANHNKVLNKLTAAKKQGKMSVEEFNTRVLTNLRSAVSLNPGETDELIRISKRTLALSGVSSLIDTEADAAKAAAASEASRDKSLVTLAGKFNISVPYNDDNTVNRQLLEPRLQQLQGEQQALQNLERDFRTGTSQDTKKALETL
jgi:hypothetical protein